MKLWCVLFFWLLANTLHAQDITDLKVAYDSILALETDKQEELLATFFEEHHSTPFQLQLAFCYHEYSKKIYHTAIDKAIEYCNRAIAIRTAHKDTAALSKSLYALGYYYALNGNYFRSIQAYGDLLELRVETSLIGKAYSRLGVVYTRIGDFSNAITNFMKAERYYKREGNKEQLVKNHINISLMFSQKGWANHRQIKYHLKKADSLSKTLEPNYRNELIINQIWGNLYDELQEYHIAIDYHKKAITNSQKMQDSLSTSMTYSNLGVSYKKLGAYDKALFYYRKALTYANKKAHLEAPVFNNLGDYFLSKQEFIEALKHYQKAITSTLEKSDTLTYVALPNIETLRLSPYKLDLLGYLTDKASAWLAYYTYFGEKEYLRQALQTFMAADQLIDVIRFESSEFQSKLFWRKQSADLYMKALHVCYELNIPEKAFYFMEKNKAILLMEDITHEKAKEGARLPVQLNEKETSLRRDILLAEEKLSNIGSDRSKADSLKDLVYKRKRRYKQFIDALEVSYPEYYSYKRELKLTSFNVAKNKEYPVLSYMLNDNDGYGLLLTENKHFFFRIKNISQLHQEIETLKRMLENPLYTSNTLLDYQSIAFSIYQKIVPPKIAGAIKNQLLIIPDHNLQQIPFEALMTSASQPGSYLINQITISYAYSLSFLDLNEKRVRNPQKVFAGYAPVTYLDTSLMGLHGSIEELTQINRHFSGDFYDKEKATKSNFINTSGNYQIIHLSTHADAGKSITPWIAFYDGELSLEQLYGTKNQADLVVLSACNTSRGELKTGEGIMSLARGFFNIGARSVISTLWKANEKSTNEILVNFYSNLKRGETKAQALQHAKLTYLKSHQGVEASPFYWGAPILIGDTKPIPIQTSNTHWYLLICVSFCITFFVIKRYLKKSKTQRQS